MKDWSHFYSRLQGDCIRVDEDSCASPLQALSFTLLPLHMSPNDSLLILLRPVCLF